MWAHEIKLFPVIARALATKQSFPRAQTWIASLRPPMTHQTPGADSNLKVQHPYIISRVSMGRHYSQLSATERNDLHSRILRESLRVDCPGFWSFSVHTIAGSFTQ